MSKQVVCDVCGDVFEISIPTLGLIVPETMPGPVPGGVWDVCSWGCLVDLAEQANGSEVEQPIGYELAEEPEVEKEQIVVSTDRPRYAREVEDAGVGSYFPEGMRVDGRPAEQLRRVRVTKDE